MRMSFTVVLNASSFTTTPVVSTEFNFCIGHEEVLVVCYDVSAVLG